MTWKLVKSELSYNLFNAVGLAAAMPLIIFLEQSYDDMPKIFTFFCVFLTLQFWLEKRGKEQRERKFNLLPVSRRQNSIVRLVVLAVFSTVFILEYALFYSYLLDLPQMTNGFIIITEILVAIYIIQFIIKDLMLQQLRARGITKYRAKMFFIFLILLLNLVTIYAFLQTKKTGHGPPFFEATISWLKSHNLLASASLPYFLAIGIIILAGLSQISYQRKKSWLE